MYACTHCNATGPFMSYREGALIRVLEEEGDTEGLDEVKELLCIGCNTWFPNPRSAARRTLTGELVTITGLKGKGTIKTVATGVKFPFHHGTHEEDAAAALSSQPQRFIHDLFEFADHSDAQLAIRVKEDDDPNTWVYRVDRRRMKKVLGVR